MHAATTDPASFTVVSGGQTGVDRAALDAALSAGIMVGGWCPRGRRAEDGQIPERYPLRETPARSYAVRTEWNVRDSDGTLIIVLNEISSGTRLTLQSARQQERPHLVVRLQPEQDSLFSEDVTAEHDLHKACSWIRKFRISTLNIAGPRGSSRDDVYDRARAFLDSLFAQLQSALD